MPLPTDLQNLGRNKHSSLSFLAVSEKRKIQNNDLWCQCFKKQFSLCILMRGQISQTVCPWKTFPDQSKVGKVRRLPRVGATERCFTQVGSGLTRKHKTRLERPAKEKHSCSFGPFISYKEIEFLKLAPGACTINI